MILHFQKLGLIVALLSLVHASPVWSQTVRLVDHLVLGETKIDGEKIGEFSALVVAPDGNGLIAVSDRGYLARLAVTIAGKDLAAVEVLSVHVLTGPDGRALRDEDVSPEAAAVLPDGSLAIVDETTARLMVFDATGMWLRDDRLPEALRDTDQCGRRYDQPYPAKAGGGPDDDCDDPELWLPSGSLSMPQQVRRCAGTGYADHLSLPSQPGQRFATSSPVSRAVHAYC